MQAKMSGYLIIAGNGVLPRIIKENIPGCKIVGFDSDAPDIAPDLLTSFGQIGHIIEFAKQHNLQKIIFAGGMKKPDFSKIKPDVEGAKLLAKIMAGKLFGGDNKLLSSIIKFLESRGFDVVGAHEAVPDLLAPEGLIAGPAPTNEQLEDIRIGLKEAHELGKKDIGQAVVIQHGTVTATEDDKGTQNLIVRAKGGILVKGCKPQQDMRADLPSIGVDTIEQLKSAGIAGVAVEAGKSLLLEREKLINAANQAGIFIYGV
jgi:DUF1009 family protein